jgi:hypothetical protein
MANVNECACDCQSQLVVVMRKMVVGSAVTMMGVESDGVRCDAMQETKGRRGVCRCGPGYSCRSHTQESESCSANVLVRLLVG